MSAVIKERKPREVSVYSTGRSERASTTAHEYERYPEMPRLKVAFVQKARCHRRACNLPASPQSLAASCHIAGVSNFAASERNKSAVRPFRSAVSAHKARLRAHVGRSLRISPVGCRQDSSARLRDLDKDHRYPYCYEFQTDNRLESSPTRKPPPIRASTPVS